MNIRNTFIFSSLIAVVFTVTFGSVPNTANALILDRIFGDLPGPHNLLPGNIFQSHDFRGYSSYQSPYQPYHHPRYNYPSYPNYPTTYHNSFNNTYNYNYSSYSYSYPHTYSYPSYSYSYPSYSYPSYGYGYGCSSYCYRW